MRAMLFIGVIVVASVASLFESEPPILEDVDSIAGQYFHELEVDLTAGKSYRIELDGDGSSDLDLLVFDGYGNLIVGDTSDADDASLTVHPNRTQRFTIRIENHGHRANHYRLTVTP